MDYIDKDGYYFVYYCFPNVAIVNLKLSNKLYDFEGDISEVNNKTEKWKLFCLEHEIPDELLKDIEEMTSDKYLQLL